MHCKNFVFEELAERGRDPKNKAFCQYMKLYELVMGMRNPLVVEFGVARGLSTCLLGTALETVGGRLVSVDVRDCSDVIESDRWTFIQGSDLDVDRIVGAAPALTSGIDLLYLDSRHTGAHVTAQLLTWFPYVNQGGVIAVDDVDAAPYRFGERKQNYRLARDCEEIASAVREFFLANEESLQLEFHFGSTGFAVMRKVSARGTRPSPPRRPSRWPLHLAVLGRLDTLLHERHAPAPQKQLPAQAGR